MKKIYLFLAMLFGMFGSTALFAQDAQYVTYDKLYGIDDTKPIITDVSQFSSPFSDEAEGNFYSLIDQLDACPEDQHPGNDFWHSDWHHADNQVNGMHYFQVDISGNYDASIGEIAFIFTRRSGATNDHVTKWSVRGTNNPDATKEACEELLTQDSPYTSSDETLTSNAFDPKDYQYLRFYAEATSTNRGFFHLSRFNLYPIFDLDLEEKIINKMGDAFKKYSAVVIQYPAGDTPGRYPKNLVDAFKAAIKALDADVVETLPASLEEVDALVQAAEDALTALQEATPVPFSLETGYYHIKALWYNDGDPRYMGGDLKDGQALGIWGAYDDIDDPVTAARILWYIENKGDGTYDMVSQYNDARFTQIERSADVLMDKNSSTLMAFDLVTTDDEGNTYVNIRVASDEVEDPTGYFSYLHQGGHSNGGGTGANMVGWNRTWSWADADEGEGVIGLYGAKASEWTFEPVDESEAQQIISDFEPYKNKFVWLDDFRHMITEAKPLVEKSKDLVDTSTPLISSADQLSSPCSDSAEGQHIEYLIDGNTGTFWHTDWHGQYNGETYHYLQVELPDNAPAVVAFSFTRRSADNDHTTQWQVYGYNDNDFDLTMDDGEWLFEAETPFTSNTETLTTAGFATEGFKYLRFYSMAQAGASYGSRTYWHASEFQLYPANLEPSPTSQYAQMGDVATTLANLIEQYEFADNDDLEYDDYLDLKAAYDAFMGFFVDPTDFRLAIRDAEAKLKTIVVGTNPGFYTNEGKAALSDAITQAKAYDAAGSYNQSDINSLMGSMTSAAESVDEAFIPVKEGKWYRIRYGTEEEYAQYSWANTGNEATYYNSAELGETEENMEDEALFGKYMVPATDEDVVIGYNDDGEVNGHRIVPLAKEDITVGAYIYCDADEDIEDKDLSMWRFIKVGDGYAIQNKATGLFMFKDGYMHVSLVPTIFTHLAAGYGQNSFIEHKLETGEEGSPMHLARYYNILTTWGSMQGDGVWSGMGSYDGRRACFFVEEVGDVAPDYTSADCKMAFTPGDIYGRCFPVPLTVKDPEQGTLWTVSNLECTDDEVKVTLAKIVDPVVPAGRPFLYVAAGDYEPEADAVNSDFSFTFDKIITTPQSDHFLKGIFNSRVIDERFIGVGSGHEEKALQFNDSGSTLGNHRVYITPGNDESLPSTDELVIVFDEEAQDGIQTALQNIVRKGAIYTVDGRFIGNGNLNDLKQKGVYIINGTKVIVK